MNCHKYFVSFETTYDLEHLSFVGHTFQLSINILILTYDPSYSKDLRESKSDANHAKRGKSISSFNFIFN
jgi:hypothetical protein